MNGKGKIDVVTRIYTFSMLLYVLTVYDVTWQDFLSYSTPIRFYIIIVSIWKIMTCRNTFPQKYLAPLITLLLYSFYCIFITLGNFYLTINYFAFLVSMTSVIMLDLNEKKYMLRVFINAIVVVLVISLIGWVQYLLGVKLPHTSLIYHRNEYHEYYDYYLFRVSLHSVLAVFPRFQSIFLEPGQMATPLVFLFYLNTIENKVLSFNNIVLLVSILLSFSLIAYGLLLFIIFLMIWFKGTKYRFLLLLGVIAFLFGIVYYYIALEDSALNALILSRLEYSEEDIITGNNRYSQSFDSMFDSFMQSSDKYFGIYNKLLSGNDWTNGSSGLKKYIVVNGLVGLFLGCLLIFYNYWINRNKRTLAYLIILTMAFVVRNQLFTPLWFSIAILGFYTLNEIKITKYGNLKMNNNI